MGKKIFAIIMSAAGAAILGFVLFGVLRFSSSKVVFETDGYVMGDGYGDSLESQYFSGGTEYRQDRSGKITFENTGKETVSMSGDSFIKFADNSFTALQDGLVLNLEDISDNFVNNYYVPSGVRLTLSNGTYRQEDDPAGTSFGENIWKLADSRYLILSPENTVHFSEQDIRSAGDYVQVTIDTDGVCRLLTEDEKWQTISPNVYVETQNGVRIYPLTSVIDNGKNKLSVSRLTVDPDGAIVVAKAEQRRQIVPEININAIDGADGDAGEDGVEGGNGVDGEAGKGGEAGEAGEEGEAGNDGGDGAGGGGGNSGNAGSTGVYGATGGGGYDGRSAYEVWQDEGNTGSMEDFRRAISGKTAMELWLAENPGKTADDYMLTLRGMSAFEAWVSEDPEARSTASEQDFKNAIAGSTGSDGLSAYEAWKEKEGNAGKSQQEFEEWLKGKKGAGGTSGADGNTGASGDLGTKGDEGSVGFSAYEIWKQNQSEGAPTDELTFLNSLKGETGSEGGTGSGGDVGSAGLSAYEVWKKEQSAGASTGMTDFLESLKGSDGSTGGTGGSGEAGGAGSDGSEGSGGASGSAGLSAYEAWKKGQAAGAPTDMQTFLNSLKGESGSDGGNAQDGSNAGDGLDAASASSTKTVLPMMTFREFKVTSYGLQGAIHVVDVDKMLDGVDPTLYPGKVVIENQKNGARISCYEVDSLYVLSSTSKQRFVNFNREDTTSEKDTEKTVYFTTDEFAGEGQVRYRLEPGTPYRISVTCFYTDSSTKALYSREFLSRTFYTETSGISFVESEAGFDRVSDIMNISDDIRIRDENTKGLRKVELYLLTPEQSKVFDVSAKSAYIYRYEFSFPKTGEAGTVNLYKKGTEGAVTIPEETAAQANKLLKPVGDADHADSVKLIYEGLNPNTPYVQRGIMTYEDENAEVTSKIEQIVEMTTMKRAPEWDHNVIPTMTYNRITGAFDVYRPTVVDVDNSVSRYRYTVFRMDPDIPGVWTEYHTNTLGPTDKQPAQFFLPTGKTTGESYKYKVNVQMEVQDNEKIVTYDLGTSLETYESGSALPRLTLIHKAPTGTDASGQSGLEQNRMVGTLRVNLGTVRSMMPIGPNLGKFSTVNETYPVDLEISSEAYYSALEKPYYSEVIHFPQLGENAGDGVASLVDHKYVQEDHDSAGNPIYKLSTVDPESETLDIDIELYSLRENTDYTITLKGYLDLTGTGKNYTYQTIGQVRFRTPKDCLLEAKFSPIPSTSEGFLVGALLKSQSGSPLDAYDLEQIAEGEVQIKLYEGNTTKGTPVGGTLYINNDIYPNGLNQLVGKDPEHPEGFQVKASMFSSGDLSGGQYTLEISSVADHTFRIEQRTEAEKGRNRYYVNYFDVDAASRTYVTKMEETPPPLVDDPEKGITSTPVLKKNASSYGLTGMYPDLDDNTVIGYILECNYANYAKKASQYNLSIFEYNEFFNALSEHRDPVGNYLYAAEGGTGTAASHAGIDRVFQMSFRIDPVTGKIPKVLVLLDDKPEGYQTEGYDCQYVHGSTDVVTGWEQFKPQYNGCIVYFAGRAHTIAGEGAEGHSGKDPNTILYGMSRGYRYTAAYTMEVTMGGTSEEKRLYPYCMEKYPEYMDSFGIGQIKVVYGEKDTEASNGYQFNKTAASAYILNSGIMKAPKQPPRFQTYLDDVTTVLQKDAQQQYSMESQSTGTAVLQYAYTDVDKVLQKTSGTGADAVRYNKVHYEGQTGEMLIGPKADASWSDRTPQGDANQALEFSVTAGPGSDGTPIQNVTVDCHRYNLDYTPMLDQYTGNLAKAHDPLTEKFAAVIAAWDYKGYIEAQIQKKKQEQESETSPVYVDIENHLDQNYLNIREHASGGNVDSLAHEAFVKAYVMEVTIQSTKGSQKLTLPILMDSKGYYAKVDVNSLSGIVDGNALQVVSIRLLYETGRMGWGIADNASNAYALRYMTYSDSELKLTDYLRGSRTGSISTSTLPGGSLFKMTDAQAEVTVDGVVRTPTQMFRGLHGGSREVWPFYSSYDTTAYLRRYLYAVQGGLNSSADSGAAVPPEEKQYLIPMECAAVELALASGSGQDLPITSVTPVISYYPGTVNLISGQAITIGDFHVNGVDQAAASTAYNPLYEMTMRLYHGLAASADARSLPDTYKGETIPEYAPRQAHSGGNDEVYVKKITFLLDSKGQIYGYVYKKDTGEKVVIPKDADGHFYLTEEDKTNKNPTDPSFEGLTEPEGKNTYVLAAGMEFAQGTGREKKVLIDEGYMASQSQNASAVYTQNTFKTLRLSITDAGYPEIVDPKRGAINNYFYKHLDFAFTTNRQKNLTMHYEIYTSEADARYTAAGDEDAANAAWKKMNVDMDPAVQADDRAVINFNREPASQLCPQYQLSTTTKVSLDLSPDVLNEHVGPDGRSMKGLAPAGTYWLRVTATEADGTVAAYDVKKFTTPSNTDYGIYAMQMDKSSSSLTFVVSAYENTKSFMGINTGETTNTFTNKALYAVRFAKVRDAVEDGVPVRYYDRIETTYDDKLYTFNSLKRQFTLKQIKEGVTGGTTYYPLDQLSQEDDRRFAILVYAVYDKGNNGNIQIGTTDTGAYVYPQGQGSVTDQKQLALRRGYRAYFGLEDQLSAAGITGIPVKYPDPEGGVTPDYLTGGGFNQLINSFWESGGVSGLHTYRKEMKDVEQKFLVYEKDKVMKSVGFELGSVAYSVKDKKKVSLIFSEASGLVMFNESGEVIDQNCDSIVWQIQETGGKASDLIELKKTDPEQVSRMIRWNKDEAYYHLDMDLTGMSNGFEITSGKMYSIIVRFYPHEGGVVTYEDIAILTVG